MYDRKNRFWMKLHFFEMAVKKKYELDSKFEWQGKINVITKTDRAA